MAYPGKIFRQPNAETNFRRLLKDGSNVVMTVDAFLKQRMSPMLCEMLVDKQYTVILDENVGEWAQIEVSECDYRILLAERLIVVSQDGHIRWRDSSYQGLFSSLQEMFREHEAMRRDGCVQLCLVSKSLKDMISPLCLDDVAGEDEVM